MYKCVNCAKDVDTELTRRIRCPYCGYRILSKKRSPIPRRVETK